MASRQQISELEERVLNLEVRSAYQDRLVTTLDEVIQEQFILIERLQSKLQQLEQKLELQNNTVQPTSLQDEVPPHY